MIDFQNVLHHIHNNLKDEVARGVVADYIPELAGINGHHFGIHLRLLDGQTFSTGMWNNGFSIQSISKVLTLAMALPMYPKNLWQRVHVEPSGNPFNHLSLLELENGIPRNPLINAGALVIADILVSLLDNPKDDFLNYVRAVVDDPTISFNQKVAESERVTGYNNYAAANLLKAYGNLENDVDDVLDFYFHQCAIEMSCEQLSKAFVMFANHGACCLKSNRLTPIQAKRINAIMLTCGFYDEAGEFAFKVGLPGKSGVGGGIVALLPNHFTIAIWSPGLNPKGNSLLGMQALEQFTAMTKLSIF